MAERFLIAVVDDEEAIRKSLSRLLRAAGFNANAYGDAQEFLDTWRLDAPDCALIDLQMPGLSGIDLLERLERDDSRPAIVMITANDDPGVRRRCLALGADAFLMKPVDGDVLLQMIDSLLDRREAGLAAGHDGG